jgi:gluconate 2-dehydrogenase gamma chain
MNRREAIQRASMVLGYTIAGPALLGIMQGCKADPELAFTPAFFTKDQALLIEELTEIIIPQTDTPGAKEAGVPMFIDRMLKEIYPKESQEAFIKNLTAFDDEARKTYGDAFVDCNKEDKMAFFKKQHDEVIKNVNVNTSIGFWGSSVKNSKPFLFELKELTLLGFFTSEPGSTKVLQYKQVPGPYKGCVPLASVGKTWAT